MRGSGTGSQQKRAVQGFPAMLIHPARDLTIAADFFFAVIRQNDDMTGHDAAIPFEIRGGSALPIRNMADVFYAFETSKVNSNQHGGGDAGIADLP